MDGAQGAGHHLVSAARLQLFERALFEVAQISDRLAVYASPVRERALETALERVPPALKGLPDPGPGHIRKDLEKGLAALRQIREELQTGDLTAAVSAALSCERWSASGLIGLLILQDALEKPGSEPPPAET